MAHLAQNRQESPQSRGNGMNALGRTFTTAALMASTMLFPFTADAERGNGILEESDFTTAEQFGQEYSNSAKGLGLTLATGVIVKELHDEDEDRAIHIALHTSPRVSKKIGSDHYEKLHRRMVNAVKSNSQETIESIVAKDAYELGQQATDYDAHLKDKNFLSAKGFSDNHTTDYEKTISLELAIGTLAYWHHLDGEDEYAVFITDNFLPRRDENGKITAYPEPLKDLAKSIGSADPDTPVEEIIIQTIKQKSLGQLAMNAPLPSRQPH